MERMKREDNFIRKSFSSSRNAAPDKLLYKFKTRNQFFQRNLSASFFSSLLFLSSLPLSLSCSFLTINGRWSEGRATIFANSPSVLFLGWEREAKTSWPTGYTTLSCNVWLKGKRWQSVKLKSQDPITSISISPEVGTNGCGEVTPRVNKRIRGNRSFHIRFSLFDVLEIVDGEGRKRGDTMGNFGTRKSLPERVVSSRGNLKIDRGNSLSLSLCKSIACREIYLTNSWLSYLGKWNGPLEPIASHFAAVER